MYIVRATIPSQSQPAYTCRSCCCFCFLCARARSWLLLFWPCVRALFSLSRASSRFCSFSLLISIARCRRKRQIDRGQIIQIFRASTGQSSSSISRGWANSLHKCRLSIEEGYSQMVCFDPSREHHVRHPLQVKTLRPHTVVLSGPYIVKRERCAHAVLHYECYARCRDPRTRVNPPCT